MKTRQQAPFAWEASPGNLSGELCSKLASIPLSSCRLTPEVPTSPRPGSIPKGLLQSPVCTSCRHPRAAGRRARGGSGMDLGGCWQPWKTLANSSISWERWALREEAEQAHSSSSSRCSTPARQDRDMDRAGCPSALGARTSSSFFVVSIRRQAGQSHFLGVLLVICKEQREVKGELGGKPFLVQAAT